MVPGFGRVFTHFKKAMADDSRDLSTEIRKLRKKLRQIENLEILERELTEEELVKVSLFFHLSVLTICLKLCKSQFLLLRGFVLENFWLYHYIVDNKVKEKQMHLRC